MYGARRVINIPPGINKDDNSFTSLCYTDANSIRFYKGLPETIGGWIRVPTDNAQTFTGVPRMLYSFVDSANVEHLLIGTNTGLFSYEGGMFFNITPISATTTPIPNSLATNYVAALGANAIATTNATSVITVTYSTLTQAILRENDVISISGVVADIGGIPFAQINGSHAITNITATTFDFVVTSTASSSATGGTGATLTTRVITVTQVAHGFTNGDRIEIAGAAGFAGFIAADLNIQSTVRLINANSYAYYLSGTTNFATSSTAAGGGAATTVAGQIAAGICTISAPEGYGGGLYGAGAYGTGKSFGTGFVFPRIWSADYFSDLAIITPGSQGGLYEWNGDTTSAPVLVSGAPAAVNYVFVAKAEGQIVVFGAGGVINNISTCSTDDRTNWTPGPGSTAFNEDVSGAGQFIASAYVKGQYLLFTQTQVYKMFYVGLPDIWVIQLLTDIDGLIGQNAFIELPDAVVWMGQNDWYIYNGSVITQVPNNTLRHWVIDNLNYSKAGLSFARRVLEFNEIWWFMPFGGSNEPNTYVIWNYEEGHWTNGTLTRTSAEVPVDPTREQFLAVGSCDGSIASALYQHEIGFSNNGSPLTGSLTTNYALIGEGDYVQRISTIIPSTQLLPIGINNFNQTLFTITVNSKEYDEASTVVTKGPYTVTANTAKVDVRVNGRQRQYVYNFSVNSTVNNGAGFRIQKSYEQVKPFTVR